MTNNPENAYEEEVGKKLRQFCEAEPIELSDRHPDRTDECLPLDRVFVAIGLEPSEKKHLEKCTSFCQRRVKSFAKLPLEERRLIPKTITSEPRAVRKRHNWAVAAVILLSVALIAAGSVKYRSLLEQIAGLREFSEIDKAFNVDFDVLQPNSADILVHINKPEYLDSINVSYDGLNFRRLYPEPGKEHYRGFTAIRDRQSFPSPGSGEQSFHVIIRPKFSKEVCSVFPEFGDPGRKDAHCTYILTAGGISKHIVSEQAIPAGPQVSMSLVPLVAEGWEVDNSPDAVLEIENDPSDHALIANFKLFNAGEYAVLRHAIPGATPIVPNASFQKVGTIEIELLYDGNSNITLEPRLSDSQNTILGATRLITPSEKNQVLRFPVSSLGPYFGAAYFDFMHVQRIDIALARKTPEQSDVGSVKINRVELLGTGEKLLLYEPPHELKLLAELPLKQNLWSKTDKSNNPDTQGIIGVIEEQSLLVCNLTLPFDRIGGRGAPWTNIESKLPSGDFGRLQAIEIELMWKGSASITLEPKLVSGLRGHTYGRFVRIKPTDKFQTIRVYLQDLRYYWSNAPSSAETPSLDLNLLNVFSLGISRKAQNQAAEGSLSIRAIRLLGLP